ncbi:MFS general substrate transporter [Xylariaceae sp. FL0255]|nr:MFS general substrate transporter [Xylariaceae sp. FL0255]
MSCRPDRTPQSQSGSIHTRPASRRTVAEVGLQLTLAVLHPCLVSFFSSFTNGIITVGLPTIVSAISLERSLYTWPSSVFGLTSGSLLLIAGAVSDLIGARYIELIGIFLFGIATIGCGLPRTGIDLIISRALQGVAIAPHLPASVALVLAVLPSSRIRNIGFSCLGLSQPFGFAVGLVLGGIVLERVSWSAAFYVAGAPVLAIALTSWWALPKSPTTSTRSDNVPSVWRRLYTEIDWVGAGLASIGLALLSYVLAILSADIAVFPAWMHFREEKGHPPLVPNSLWRKLPFTTICIMLALSYGQQNSVELYSSLYFQEVQSASTLTASLYLLPNLIAGTIINLTMGLILAPLGGDTLFTVGLLVVSDSFPEMTQSLAVAVFNTAAQFGLTIGIGMCQVVALSIEDLDASEKDPILQCYRASFWTMTAYMLTRVVLAMTGLRKIGAVGLKRDQIVNIAART